MFPILETKRLVLREITNNDVEAVFSCFSNKNVTRFYGQEPLQNIEQAEKLVELFSQSCNVQKGIRYLLTMKLRIIY